MTITGDVPELLAVVTLRVASPLLLLCGADTHGCTSTRLCTSGREARASGRVTVVGSVTSPDDTESLKVSSYLEDALGEIIPVADVTTGEEYLTKEFGADSLFKERTCEVVRNIALMFQRDEFVHEVFNPHEPLLELAQLLA